MMRNLELQATPEEVMRAVDELRAFGRAQRIDDNSLFGPALALEECAANIVHYACGDRAQEKFRVGFDYADGALTIELGDHGPAFDPSSAVARELVAAADEDRPPGGWGMHLVRHYMDEVRYAREGGENVLRLVKRLQSSQT